VLNSFLQFLEQDDSQGLIIAATNHPELLDRALFRRFDDVIEYVLPNADLIERLLKARLGDFTTKGVDWRKASEAAVGLSQAEVVRAAEEAAKTAVLTNTGSVTSVALEAAIADRRKANITTLTNMNT
jgi:AAA+ superfamily predicted ATPase